LFSRCLVALKKGVMSILLWHSPFSNLSKRLSATGLQKINYLNFPLPYTPLLSHFALFVYGTYSSMLRFWFLFFKVKNHMIQSFTFLLK
jgi:hypothetical protein